MKKIIYLSLLNLFIFSASQAQKSSRFVEKNYWLKEAEKQIQLGLYNQADNSLLQFFDKRKLSSLDYETQWAKYLKLLCELKLNKDNAENNFSKYVNSSIFNVIKERGNFILGRHFFNKNNFELAIPAFEKSGIDFLTNEEISKRNFELAYAFLATQKLEKVESLFASVKGIPGEYFTPGNYYHGLFSYYNKNYDEAVSSFKQAEKDEVYKTVVPFYLTEIDYLKGQKETSLTNAKKLLNSSQELVYKNELNQLIGQINFEKESFKEAEKYFSTYIANCESPRKEDFFRLGYAQFQQAKLDEAIANFSLMKKDDDALSQKAAYFSANCYLGKNQKDNAYNSFLECSQLGNDNYLKEVSEFNIAKLSYENKDDNLAEKQLNSFIKKYPSSKYYSECVELLSYLNIKNDRFDDAMISMNKLKTISEPLKKMYQRANFARGIQMLIDENSERALSYFDESNRYKVDENISNLTAFWQAEAMYRMGKYEESLDFAEYFLNNASVARYQDYIHKIHLLKSYIYFHDENTEKLNEEFALIADPNVSSPEKLLGSAKSNFIPESIPIVENDPYVLVYNLPEIKTNFSYSPIPLRPLALGSKEISDVMKSYFKVGIGNLSTYNLEIGADLSNQVLFPLYLDYRSTSTSRENLKFQRFSQSHLGIKTEKKIGNYLVNAVVAYDRNKQYYYGYNHAKFDYTSTDIKQVFSNFGISLDALPSIKLKNDIAFHPKANIGIYKDKFQANESSLKLSLPFEKKLENDTKAQVEFLADLNIYHVANLSNQNNSMLMIKPSVEKKYRGANVKIGLYPVVAQKLHLLQDVYVSYPLSNKQSIFEAGWQSCLKLNTFKDITTVNPFIFNYFKVKQSKYTDLFVGLKGNYNKNISYSSRIGFATYKNMPLFLNDTAFDNKQFKVLFDEKATLFIAEASINYTFNTNMLAGVDVSMKPVIKTTTEEKAWGYRPNTIDLYAKIKATKEIVLRTDFLIRSGSYVIEKSQLVNSAYARTLSGALDINVALNYTVNPNWNVFLDFNNLLNNKYQRWYGYENFGTNIQFGLIRMFNQKNK